jgi:uncharacterized phiE125 gp8 family phage protein
VTTALIRETAPATEPVTLAQAKDQLRVTHDDEDTLIGRLVSVAVAHFDATGALGRAMITQDWAQWEPQSPGYVRLDMGPFQSLVSVEYYDADGVLQTADLADFETRLKNDFVICRPKENAEWPNADDRDDAIKITYRVGYGDADDVPENVKHAILLLVGHLYENRESSTEAALKELPMGIEFLLNNERVGWYG